MLKIKLQIAEKILVGVHTINPEAEIHVSTQASIVSPEAAMAYVQMGAKRLGENKGFRSKSAVAHPGTVG